MCVVGATWCAEERNGGGGVNGTVGGRCRRREKEEAVSMGVRGRRRDVGEKEGESCG